MISKKKLKLTMLSVLCSAGFGCVLDACAVPKTVLNGANTKTSTQSSPGKSSLGLQLPSTLPASCNQIRITLTSSESGASNSGSTVYNFSPDEKNITINDLNPGHYHIAVDFMDTKNNGVVEHGDGDVTIEANRIATATIILKPRTDNTGSLVISIVQGTGTETSCSGELREFRDMTVRFGTDIITGSKRGHRYYGGITYQVPSTASAGETTVDLLDFRFCYAGHLVTLSNFDPIYNSKPSALLLNGKFERLTASGGDGTARFGINAGFGRADLARMTSLDFIANGEDYFGYLDRNTIVDGAGRIFYYTEPASN